MKTLAFWAFPLCRALTPTFSPQVCKKLVEAGLDDVIVFGGGIIPHEDRPALHEAGIRAVFGPEHHLGNP